MRGGIPAASRRGQIEGADGSRTRLVARNGIRFPVTPRDKMSAAYGHNGI